MKTRFMFILLLLIAVFLLPSALAYTKVCLTKGQSVPPNNPVYTCKHTMCQVCVNSNLNPTDPNYCEDLQCVSLDQLGNVTTNNTNGSGGGGIDLSKPILTVINPVNSSVYTKGVVHITAGTNVMSNIEFMDMTKSRKSWQTLCRGCTFTDRMNHFNDGENDIVIRATKLSNGLTDEKEIEFAVDSKKPMIDRTDPKNKQYADGTFTMDYSESNLALAELFYGTSSDMRSLNMTFCESGNRQSCSATVDLKDFDGQTIDFYFKIMDIASSTAISRLTSVFVDATAPKITGLDVTNKGNVVKFNVTIDDSSAKIDYMDLNARMPRFNDLCNKKLVCIVKRGLSRGEHDLIVRAIDKAGNFDERNVTVNI